MIQIDGSFHEGGGQILRTALSLSSLTGQPFEIANIRKNRHKPGLRPQHLSCVKAAAELCNGSFENAEVSSTAIKFYPRKVKSRTLSVDIGTAGSITLLLQSLLPPLVFGDKKFRVKVTGGSDVPFSPPSDYFASALLPHLRKYCDEISYNVLRRGFVHEGGGRAELMVKPKFPLSSYGSFSEFLEGLRSNAAAKINLVNQGKLLQIKGASIASTDLQRAEVAERQTKAARMDLMKLNVPISIGSSYAETLSTGSVITLWAVFSESGETSEINPVILGGSSLGELGKRAEEVGKEAATQLLQEFSSNAPVDRHLADQLLPFLAIATGRIMASQLTPHALTNVYVIEKFLGNCFEVNEANSAITGLR